MKKSIVILATVAVTAIIISLVGTVTATDENYYFAVQFDTNGRVIEVIVPTQKEKVIRRPIDRLNPLQVDRLDLHAVGHKDGGSPCCYVDHLGYKWCWPPCQ
jgi:hypothetical protein